MSEVIKKLYEAGKLQDVLDEFTQKEIQGEWATLPEEEQIECIYHKCRSLIWLGRIEEALQTATIARTTYLAPKNPSSLLALLAAQFYALQKLGRSQLDEAQSVLAEGEVIIRALNDNERQAGALWTTVFEHVKGIDYYCKREYDKALEYYYKALKSFEALEYRHGIAHCLQWIGYTYYFKNENDSSLDYYQRSLTLHELLGNTRGIAECLDGIGHLKRREGELDTALDYYQRGLSFSDANGSSELIAYALTHCAAIYSRKGNPTKALDYFQQCLALVEPTGDETLVAYIINLIGEAYHQKGSLDQALTFFQKGLAKFEALNNDYEAVRSLFHLVLLSLDQQEVKQAQKFLITMQKVATRIPDEAQRAHRQYRLAEALILKQNPRMTEKGRAQTLLREIVNEDWEPEFALIAMVALCDLLLYELKAAGESEVWEEAKTLIHQFYAKAKHSQEIHMVVNALLLRSKFVTIDGDLDQAQEYLNEAKMIIKEKNLSLVMNKVETEQKEFEADFQKLQGLVQQNTTLDERIVQAQLKEYIQEAQKEITRMSLILDN